MEDLQRHMRETGIDHKIASSVQKRIQDIVQNDGCIQTANDRLNEFAETTAGKTILGMAKDLMTELDLTFTEQVFLQETGLNSKEENVNATKLSINDLLDTYDRLERPISQIDGVDDDEVVYVTSTPTGSNHSRSRRSRSNSRCRSPHHSHHQQRNNSRSSPRTPQHETSGQRFRREYLENFARGCDNLDEVSYPDGLGDCSSGWETTDATSSPIYIGDDSHMGTVRGDHFPEMSGFERINWTANSTPIVINSSLYETARDDSDCQIISGSSPNRSVRFAGPSSPRGVSPGARRRLGMDRVASTPPIVRSVMKSPAGSPRAGNSYRAFEEGVANQAPRDVWEGFDINNPPNEQRFFEINDIQMSYLRDALKIPLIQPVNNKVVQVGHTLIINATMYVDEKDTKQFQMGQVFSSVDDTCENPTRSIRGSVARLNPLLNLETPVSARRPADGTYSVVRSPERTFNVIPTGHVPPELRRSPQNSRSPVHRSIKLAAPRSPMRRAVAPSRRAELEGNFRRLDLSLEDDTEQDFSENWQTMDEGPGDDSELVDDDEMGGTFSIEGDPMPYVFETAVGTIDGMPYARVGGRTHGYYPDENSREICPNPNLTPVDYAEFGLPDDFDIDILQHSR